MLSDKIIEHCFLFYSTRDELRGEWRKLHNGELNDLYFFPVALRPNAGHGLLILEVSRSHTTTHHSR